MRLRLDATLGGKRLPETAATTGSTSASVRSESSAATGETHTMSSAQHAEASAMGIASKNTRWAAMLFDTSATSMLSPRSSSQGDLGAHTATSTAVRSLESVSET